MNFRAITIFLDIKLKIKAYSISASCDVKLSTLNRIWMARYFPSETSNQTDPTALIHDSFSQNLQRLYTDAYLMDNQASCFFSFIFIETKTKLVLTIPTK